jgi:hypothetical protein
LSFSPTSFWTHCQLIEQGLCQGFAFSPASFVINYQAPSNIRAAANVTAFYVDDISLLLAPLPTSSSQHPNNDDNLPGIKSAGGPWGTAWSPSIDWATMHRAETGMQQGL